MVVFEGPVYNVVFIIEGSANVGAYFDNLKSSYIQPTLEYFNGGPPEEVDYGCVSNCTLYTLVTYYGSDRTPGQLSACLEPTTSIYQLLQSMEHIDFASGFGDTGGHLAEGLSTALQVFDDIDALREPHLTPQKHCVLVCNSAPYQLPSDESSNYSRLTCDEMLQQFVEKEINFSVISPRKIPALYKLFDVAGGDLSSNKNFTTDSRHLVLLKGYQLADRPLSPGMKKDESSVVDSKPPVGIAAAKPLPANLRAASNVPPRLPMPGAGPPSTNSAARETAHDILIMANRGRMPSQPGQFLNTGPQLTRTEHMQMPFGPQSMSIGQQPINISQLQMNGGQQTANIQSVNINQQPMNNGQQTMNMGQQPANIQPINSGQQPMNIQPVNIGQQTMNNSQQSINITQQLMNSGQQPGQQQLMSNQTPMSMSQTQMPISIGQTQISVGQVPVGMGPAQISVGQSQGQTGLSGVQQQQSAMPASSGPTIGYGSAPSSSMVSGQSLLDSITSATPGPGLAPDLQVMEFLSASAAQQQLHQQQQRTIWAGTLEWAEKQKN
jgi:mediator of RNA polymerase II transcription subunit 25